MVNDPTSTTEGERRQAYLRCVCATLNFDVGEIWSWRNEEHDSDPVEDARDDDGGDDSGPMRFVQLYTSPSFRDQRSKLVTPAEDWEQNHTDVSKHKFSPLICEAVRDGGGVVWANTEVQEGLLGRSDLPLRTAVGAPVYTQGRELGVLVLFSPSLIQNSASTMEFLYTLAQAASASDTTDAFLPALASYFPVGPAPPPPTVALRASPAWRRGSAQNRLRRLDALRASLPVDVMFQTLAMGQMPNPERSLRAVRSVYNDAGGRHRVVVGAGGSIPAEFFRPGGGGLMVGNRSGGKFIPSGALTTSDINTRGGTASDGGSGSGGGGSGSSSGGGGGGNAKRPLSLGAGAGGGGMMLLEDGAGGGGGGAGSASAGGGGGGMGWLVLPGEEGGVGWGGSQTPCKRGSFQSNASVDFGLTPGADEGLLDSEEYSLWAAFMKPDSPALSPAPSPGSRGFSAESLDKAGGGRDGGAGSGQSKPCSRSTSYQTLSELLSTNVGTPGISDDDDGSSGGVGDDAAAAAAADAAAAAAVAAASSASADFLGLKQEFVDESLLKQEYDKDEAETGWGGAAAAVDGGRQIFSLRTEKRMFPASETSASTTAAGFGGTAAMSAAAAGGGGGGNRKGLPGVLLAAHNSAAAAKAVAAERRGFVGDEQKRKRFDEFILGFLSMSLFQAADIWLPLSSRNGGGGSDGDPAAEAAGWKGNKVSRLFLYSSKVQDPALAKWSSLSRNVVLASGVGLPGIVFRERRPQWAVDYSQVDSERNPLASVARLLGIGSAFGVPLSLGADDECGVLMLYSMSCLPPSELMVEFMERSTRLLLEDGPAPTTVVQQFRDNPPSAKDIGRVAGAYQHHALWAEHHVRSNGINGVGVGGTRRSGGGVGFAGSLAANLLLSQDGSGGFGNGGVGGGGGGGSSSSNYSNGRSSPLMAALSECAAADWSGDRAALAVAAVAAASGGQGGGFRPDGGAVAFVPPPPEERPGSKASSGPFLFNRIDLDSRPPVAENNGRGPPVPPVPVPVASAAVASLDLKPAAGKGGRSSPAAAMQDGAAAAAARGGVGKLWASGRGATTTTGKGKSKARGRASSAQAAAAAPAPRRAAAGRAAAGGGGGRKAASPAGGQRGGKPSGGGSAPPASTAAAEPAVGGASSASTTAASAAAAAATAAAACRAPGCTNPPNGRTPFCWDHWSAARQCQHAGCDKLSQGNTRLCIAHGGGRRCTHPGCNKGARDRFFCAAHGGGKRCSVPECGKAAVGGSDLCTGHGGGKRCQFPNCPKSAQSKTNFCVRHGGGRKCSIPGCLKVARGRTSHCAAHGGGVRCCVESCNKAAVGRERMCRSHQRRSKNASAAAAAAAAAGGAGVPALPPGSMAAPAPASGSAPPAAAAALSVLSAAAATHSVSDFLDPSGLGGGGDTGIGAAPMMQQQQQQQLADQGHLVPSTAAAAAAVAATTAAASRQPFGGVGGASSPRWGIPVGGGGRKRSAAVAMAGGGPADDIGALRGGGGGGAQRSYRLASPFPPC